MGHSLVSRRGFIKLGAAALLAGCTSSHSEAAWCLVHGTLIDGTGADPVPNAALAIEDGRIVAAGTHAEARIPQGTRQVDVQGATILPGLFNSHIHGGYSKDALAAWAQGGVTTVRDLSCANRTRKSGFALRDKVRADPQVARLVAAGPMITVPNGYPIARWNVDSVTVDSVEDARRKTAELLDDGADLIKIPLESGVIFRMDMPMLSPEEAAAIVEEAHKRGARVSVHVSVARDLARALDAGVDDIAHMATDRVPDELIQRMVGAGTYWVPTLELWRGVGFGPASPIASNLARFVEAGGQVALGTDYAGAPEVRFDLGTPVTEVLLMHEAGMTPMQVVVAATRNAAQVCNLGQELGTLEPGKVADLVVVDGNPLDDLSSLGSVRMVVHRGTVIRGSL